MIAMQYGFTLPSDYEMSIIDRRISENGHKLDGFPHLRFKAYLTSRRGELGNAHNCYTPFYLWDRVEGMEAFLSGPGFETVSNSFGRPDVHSWIVWQALVSERASEAGFAVVHHEGIEPGHVLADLRSAGAALVEKQIGMGAVAALCGFDPKEWRMVTQSLWAGPPPSALKGQRFAVGYVAGP